ncbi:hypothetical protein [Nocardiopsis nanhaiensis]
MEHYFNLISGAAFAVIVGIAFGFSLFGALAFGTVVTVVMVALDVWGGED